LNNSTNTNGNAKDISMMNTTASYLQNIQNNGNQPSAAT
jgi:hypothetical protein